MSWFESEDFWTNYSPIMFDDNRWAEAPAVAQYVKQIAALNPGNKVLDAGCGIGRISVELAALGLDVTGVDIIQNELDAAADSAAAEGVPLNLVKADLRTYRTQKPEFHCAVNLFTSFGYCDTVQEDLQILKNIADSLLPGGTFIIESTSKEIARLYFTPGEEFDRAGMHVITEFSPVGQWEGLRSRWTLIAPDGSKIDHEFVQRLYSAQELKEHCINAGFKTAEFYGDFDMSPYNNKARTMVLIARK